MKIVSLKDYRLGKQQAGSWIGLILGLLQLNAGIAGVNPWVLSFVVFLITTTASFLPSTGDWDGNWYRPLMKATNILMLLGAVAGWMLDNPKEVIHPDGTITMVTVINIAVLQSVINSINLFLSFLEESAAKSVPPHMKRAT